MPAIVCPTCATPLEIPDELVGRFVRCASCSNTFMATPSAPTGAEGPPKSYAPISTAPLPESAPAPSYQPEEEYRHVLGQRRDLAPHRGVLILVMGIISLVMGLMFMCVCGFLDVITLGVGIAAWMMANNDIRRMEAGEMDPDGRGQTTAGKVCGIIGVVLSCLVLLLYLAYMVFFVAMMATGR